MLWGAHSSLVEAWGDSAFVGPVLSGQARVTKPLLLLDLPYFKGADPRDPLVLPGVSATLLAKFPPTLLISGSRAAYDVMVRFFDRHLGR